jgi:hypothetical protein
MQTSIKIFTCTIAMSIALTACGKYDNEHPVSGIPLCKQGNRVAIPISYDELDSSCESELKKLVSVTDLHQEEIDCNLGSVSVAVIQGTSSGEPSSYFWNGEKVSEERFYELTAERNKRQAKCNEQRKDKRDLSIPCVVFSEYAGWVALLTDEEIAELQEKYDELSIEDYREIGAGTDEGCYVSSSSNAKSSSSSFEFIMSSKVVSYQRTNAFGSWYGFIDDDEMKLRFKHIFNDKYVKEESECNYFALYWLAGGSGQYAYRILSEDMVFYQIACVWREPPAGGDGSMSYYAMLICDDKAGSLKEKINFDSVHYYKNPYWECETGTGGPNWEEVYF